jgi:hypothetical protein
MLGAIRIPADGFTAAWGWENRIHLIPQTQTLIKTAGKIMQWLDFWTP